MTGGGKNKPHARHVVVLHGIGMSRSWMLGLARVLKKSGYIVHNVSYPSRHKGFEQLVEDHIAPVMLRIPAGHKVDFVGHSMGGILIRFYAKIYGSTRIGRAVMIGTPNHGSEVADYLRRWPAFGWFFGAAGLGLGTRHGDAHAALPPVDFECGVIAGSSNWLHFPLSYMTGLPEPNDGLVTVDSTRIEGMSDHAVLNVDHSMMVWTPEVWRHAVAFLETGKFPAAPRLRHEKKS